MSVIQPQYLLLFLQLNPKGIFLLRHHLHIELKSFLKNEFLNDDKLTNYYINKDIRVFPNEIYYFDHPKFGVLVSIKDKP